MSSSLATGPPTKNVWLKLACVGIVVVLFLWLLETKKLRWGIDIQGGHSLIFEVKTEEAERKSLEAEEKQLEQKLSAGLTEKELQDVKKQLKWVKDRLDLLTQQGQGNLSNRIIALLKKRVDPQGLRSLEWRPLGSDRIEIRMAAGKADTRRLRDNYFKALEELERNNIHYNRNR